MHLAETVLVALFGGWLFHLAGLPLPWLLGAITILLVWKFALKRNVYGHKFFRPAALVIIGYNIGSSFSRETVSLLAEHLPYMLLASLLIMAAAVLIMLIMTRKLKTSRMTALLSNVPGGLSMAVSLAQEMPSANLSVVVFSQTVRVFAVIYTVPFLTVHLLGARPLPAGTPADAAATVSGWQAPALTALAVMAFVWLLKKARFPVPELLGAVTAVILLASFGWEVPVLPGAAGMAAQTLMGISLAEGMEMDRQAAWRKLAPLTLAAAFYLVVVSMGVAWLIAKLTALDYVSAFLSVAAGGMAEMVLTGAQVGANLPVIAAYQLCRILTMLFLLPPMAKWVMRHEGAPEIGS